MHEICCHPLFFLRAHPQAQFKTQLYAKTISYTLIQIKKNQWYYAKRGAKFVESCTVFIVPLISEPRLGWIYHA